MLHPVMGIFTIDAAITRYVGALLVEYDEHCQMEGSRKISDENMAAVPALEELPALRIDSD